MKSMLKRKKINSDSFKTFNKTNIINGQKADDNATATSVFASFAIRFSFSR